MLGADHDRRGARSASPERKDFEGFRCCSVSVHSGAVVGGAAVVVVDNASLDVDVFEEKLTVNRTELNDDVVDPNYAFEEGVFEIELRGEEVEVGKRVRRIGQVEFGKERQTRTQRVTGQTRREELEFDEEPYGGSAT